MSGVHEALVKSAKKAIYHVLKDGDITDEELHSAFVSAEGLLNSCPLTYQSANPDDVLPLTPNHFLLGRTETTFAPAAVDNSDYDIRVRWRRVQELERHVWSRWLKEWLPSLGARAKWRRDQPEVKVGDVALVVHPDTARGHWPLGRVEAIYPGPDGHVRTVDIRMNGQLYRRPIVRLCPLGI